MKIIKKNLIKLIKEQINDFSEVTKIVRGIGSLCNVVDNKVKSKSDLILLIKHLEDSLDKLKKIEYSRK